MSNLATITNNILADSGIDDINVVVTNGSYANPAWITSLAWIKITGAPTIVTSVTASSPLFSSGGTTPNITIQQASGSQNGFLSSTDWTTFNNKQNALINPVTGTGANGRVAFWNGTNTQSSDAGFTWDNTNKRLGIGTAAPSSLLHLEGSAPVLTMNRTSGGFSNRLNFNTNGINYASLISEAGTGEQRYSIGPSAGWGGFHTFYIDTTERMRIFNDGNVLIQSGGTFTNNGARLQVNGTATFSSTINASDLITSNSGFRTNSLNGYVLRNDGNNLNLGGLTRRGFWAGGTAADTQIFAETGYSIFINPGGLSSVGLTLAPSGAATFSSSVTAGSFIRSGGTSTQYLMADGSVSTLTNPVTGTGTTNYLPRFTGASTIANSLLFDNGTNIGLGTIIPLAKLHIEGSGSTYTSPESSNVPGIYIHNTNSSSTTANTFLSLRTSGSGGGDPILSWDINGVIGWSAGIDNSDGDSFKIANSWLALDSSTRFEINGSGRLRLNAYGSGTFTGTATRNLAVDSSGNVIEVIDGGGTVTGTGTTNYLSKFTGTSSIGNSSIFDNGTNVGIGTASNTTALVEVFGSALQDGTNPGFRLSSSNTGQTVLAIVNTTSKAYELSVAGSASGISGGFYIYDITTQNTRFVVSSAGNILLNTTSDNGARLQVSGRAYINNVGSSVAGTTIYGNDQANVRLRLENVNGRTWELTGGLTGANNSDFTIYDVTATATRMIINSSGNLGLGVTPPAWSVFRAINIFNGSFSTNSLVGGGVVIARNWYFDGVERYFENGTAQRLELVSNGFFFQTAPINSSGAGASLTWTSAMTLNSAGNLGLGVTPQPWTSAHRVIQFGAIGSIETDNDAVAVSNNRYFDGTNRYSANDFATIYVQVNGEHRWLTAPAGIANNAITFSTPMMLTTAGRLLLGDTLSDNGARLQVSGTSTFSGELNLQYNNAIQTIQGNTGFSLIRLYGGNGSSSNVVEFQIRNRVDGGDFSTIGNFSNHDLQIRTNNTARLTIAASTGAATFSSSVTAGGRIGAGGSGNTTNAFSGQNNSTAEATIYSFNHNAAGWSIYSAQGVNYFAGNVGIGTPSPQSPIDVISPTNGYVSFGRNISVGQWTGIHFGYREDNTLYRKSAIVFERTGGAAQGNIHFLNNNANDITSASLSDSRMTITSGGNVLIGTTTDNGSRFQVSGTATISGQFVQGGGVGRSTNGTTVAFTGGSQTIWTANTDCGDNGRFLSIVNENASTSAFSALSFRVNPGGGGAGNVMLDMKFVNNGSGVSGLYWTFLSGGSFFDRMILTNSGSLTATAFFESSDSRLKSNIINLDVDVRNIVAKHYTKEGVDEIGYLAQDVESILPSAISKRKDGYLDLSYRQVHTAKIAYLEKRITELEQQLKNKYENN